MAETLLRFLARAGAGIPSPFLPERQYVRPQRGDAAKDSILINRDMGKIGSDLRKVAKKELAKHGE